ncbi:MAG: hypothetical protein AB1611_06045 [bacterium]
MQKKGYCMSLAQKSLAVFFLVCIFILGIALQEGLGQYYNPYFDPFLPVTPFAPVSYSPYPLLPPVPIAPVPYIRAPQATIILSTGITAVSPTAGAVVIGAPTVVTPTTAPTIVSTTTPTVTTAAPSPLFSILAVLYSGALYAPAPLSTANPLLFAYLSSLFI